MRTLSQLMDNITLARLLDETAALLEIDAADPFRIRSYRRAAEAVEQQTTQLATLATPEADPKLLLAIPGIGKGMAANIRDLVATGTMPLRDELLQKYRPTMLELLRLPGMGPKTVALLWSALQVADIDALEAAAKAGHLSKLPRMGEKFTVKFYLIAMLFLAFDIEVAFLYPWAWWFNHGGWEMVGMLVFFLLLLEVGYVYLYKKGALDWE